MSGGVYDDRPGAPSGPDDLVDPTPYALVVPVKTLSLAKSRLHGHPRQELMRAFALDALAAAVHSPLVHTVHVVTDEDSLAVQATDLGCVVLPDEGGGQLNAALLAAVARLAAGPVAAMLGDLPCLTPDDLTAALTWAATTYTGRPAYVVDAVGTGTTLLAAGDPADFAPHFGAGSAMAHRTAGYQPVPLPLAGLRQDVDTAEDLEDALVLGVGARTRSALALPDGDGPG